MKPSGTKITHLLLFGLVLNEMTPAAASGSWVATVASALVVVAGILVAIGLVHDVWKERTP